MNRIDFLKTLAGGALSTRFLFGKSTTTAAPEKPKLITPDVTMGSLPYGAGSVHPSCMGFVLPGQYTHASCAGFVQQSHKFYDPTTNSFVKVEQHSELGESTVVGRAVTGANAGDLVAVKMSVEDSTRNYQQLYRVECDMTHEQTAAERRKNWDLNLQRSVFHGIKYI